MRAFLLVLLRVPRLVLLLVPELLGRLDFEALTRHLVRLRTQFFEIQILAMRRVSMGLRSLWALHALPLAFLCRY